MDDEPVIDQLRIEPFPVEQVALMVHWNVVGRGKVDRLPGLHLIERVLPDGQGDKESEDDAEHKIDIGLHAAAAWVERAPAMLERGQGADPCKNQGPEQERSIQPGPESGNFEKEREILVGVSPYVFIVVTAGDKPPDKRAGGGKYKDEVDVESDPRALDVPAITGLDPHQAKACYDGQQDGRHPEQGVTEIQYVHQMGSTTLSILGAASANRVAKGYCSILTMSRQRSVAGRRLIGGGLAFYLPLLINLF